ncbi:unnamed protein product, partial [Litomosoides sigmodontis]
MENFSSNEVMNDEEEKGSSDEIELLLKCMDKLKETKLNIDVKQANEHEMQKDFLEVHNDYDETAKTSLSENGMRNNCVGKNLVRNCCATSALYTFNNCFGYVDFVQCSHDGFARTHKIHEFSWDDQGYSCVDELYNEMADILDKKMTLVQNLTYSTMGAYSDVDTSKYRNAIWMYIQSLY